MKTVAVIFGGQGGEHEVSCVSARFILSSLAAAGFNVLPIAVTLDGKWYRGDSAQMYLEKGSVPKDAAHQPFVPGQPEPGIDVVFPIIHGTSGEDGCLQGLLEWCGLPYVGPGVFGSTLGMDKIAQKTVLRASGIPVADWSADQAAALSWGFPLFVKPSNTGSSVGITKVHNAGEWDAAVSEAQKHDHRLIFEKAVPEARELEISILGNGPFRTSVVGEVVPSNEFYDYAAKYLDNASAVHIPAELPDGLADRISKYAKQACAVLDINGLSRVDFLLSRLTGELFLNEVNTLPGFTPISMYPKLWDSSGLAAPALVAELVRLAEERAELRKAYLRQAPLTTWWVST